MSLSEELDSTTRDTAGTVDSYLDSDNFAFRGAFNKPAGGGYLAYLDFDGNGVINTGDNFELRGRFNKALSWKA